MKKCPNCNYETDRNDDLFCCKCGTKLKTIRLNDFCSTFVCLYQRIVVASMLRQ